MPRKKTTTRRPRKVGRIGLRAKPGSMVTEEQVRDVGSVFLKLVNAGKGSAEELVAAATDKESPAHRHFEWNDKRAAHQHRLSQARKYIRSFEVISKNVSTEPIRAFYPVYGDGRYERIDKVVENVDLLQALIQDAKSSLITWTKRYEQLRDIGEMRGIFLEIDRIVS